MSIKNRTIQAEQGKELMRIADKMRFGSELTLGYTYYIGGEKLDSPKWEMPEDYTEVESIESIKARVIQKIVDYDESENVNSFLINGQKEWLHNAKRVSLMNSTTIRKNIGKSHTSLWLKGQQYIIECDKMIHLLELLENYALECYNVTEMHKVEVESMYDAEELEAYDLAKDYPEPLEIGGML